MEVLHLLLRVDRVRARVCVLFPHRDEEPDAGGDCCVCGFLGVYYDVWLTTNLSFLSIFDGLESVQKVDRASPDIDLEVAEVFEQSDDNRSDKKE